ncbi:hypothetical protein [Streptomyces sp. NPDC058092]|uniref:hypothetical protein n=1 Tax=Streptomyces sp. NPDC058092 TaxID=3346336 RepID=UPI0036E475F2
MAHIGSFGLPSASGRFKSADQGFIEPYLTAGCGRRVTVTYGMSVGTEAGVDYTGGPPTVTDTSSGSCLSTTSKTTGQGQQVTVTGSASTAAGSRTPWLNPTPPLARCHGPAGAMRSAQRAVRDSS